MQDEIFAALYDVAVAITAIVAAAAAAAAAAATAPAAAIEIIFAYKDRFFIPIQFRISPVIDATAEVAAIADAAAAVNISAASATASDDISRNCTKYLLIL
jgi:hypothetical protein